MIRGIALVCLGALLGQEASPIRKFDEALDSHLRE